MPIYQSGGSLTFPNGYLLLVSLSILSGWSHAARKALVDQLHSPLRVIALRSTAQSILFWIYAWIHNIPIIQSAEFIKACCISGIWTFFAGITYLSALKVSFF